jgi:hypothetical protein
MKTNSHLEEFRNQGVKRRRIPSVFKQWWWVAFFSISSTLLYTVAYGEKKQIYSELACKLGEMRHEKGLLEEMKNDYLLKIASQEDPAWIEMMLMRDLGVVPDGWLKVHFQQ